MNDSLRPESLPLDKQAVDKTYADAFARARNKLKFESASSGEQAHDNTAGLDDATLTLVDAHLDRAESRLGVRTELPARLQRRFIGRIPLVRRLALRAYELLFREQRFVGHAFVGAWRDFLRSYRQRQASIDKRLHELNRHLVAAQKELQRQDELLRDEDNRLKHALAAMQTEFQRLLTRQQEAHRIDLMHLRDLWQTDAERAAEHRRELRERLRLAEAWLLARERPRQSGGPDAVSGDATVGAPASEPAGMDAYYLQFENAFRGPREAVIDNLIRDYEPVLSAAGIGAGAKALDIGCGRGEWLGVLTDWGLKARGVDLNPVVSTYCQQLELDVQVGDGIAALAATPEASLDLVSAMHVAEHLPLEALIRFVDEALRSLRPGGLLILETPNPENLIVGSCNFWNDPTHQRPLPPEPTRFLLQSRGFENVEILRLHPRGVVDANTTGGLSELLERLYIGQDYALIAKR